MKNFNEFVNDFIDANEGLTLTDNELYDRMLEYADSQAIYLEDDEFNYETISEYGDFAILSGFNPSESQGIIDYLRLGKCLYLNNLLVENFDKIKKALSADDDEEEDD